MFTILQIKLYLKNNLSYHRYSHSIRVAREAVKLAKYYKVNKKNAYMAGLLHDIAKEYDMDKNLNLVNKYNLSINILDNNNICHSIIGAYVSKELFNINDDIFNAIKYHNIGNIGMSILDKIIFIADKIEVGKNYLGIDEERELAYIDLDKALIKCIENNKVSLIAKGKQIHKDTEELLEYLKYKI